MADKPTSKEIDWLNASFRSGTINLDDITNLRIVREALRADGPLTMEQRRKMGNMIDGVIDSALVSNWKGGVGDRSSKSSNSRG